jgi:hypothetical protein
MESSNALLSVHSSEWTKHTHNEGSIPHEEQDGAEPQCGRARRRGEPTALGWRPSLPSPLSCSALITGREKSCPLFLEPEPEPLQRPEEPQHFCPGAFEEARALVHRRRHHQSFVFGTAADSHIISVARPSLISDRVYSANCSSPVPFFHLSTNDFFFLWRVILIDLSSEQSSSDTVCGLSNILFDLSSTCLRLDNSFNTLTQAFYLNSASTTPLQHRFFQDLLT